jgi:hypothetical protein
MGKESRDWAIAYCGLNCVKCDTYQAAHGNAKLMEEIVGWLKKERQRKVKPEEITCEGCRGPLDVHWSPDCRIMLCARKKKVQYCFQCKQFRCSILDAFASDGASHHRRTVENLHRMKQIGVVAWTLEQEKKGKCEFCP